MTKLICWFSILFPVIKGDDDVEEDVSLKYLTEGNNKNSPCISYVKGYNDSITDDDKQNSLIFWSSYLIIVTQIKYHQQI